MSIRTLSRASGLSIAVAGMTAFAGSASAAPLQISDAPLFLQESVAPLNLLVVGRDHKLYYEAYNDASDLDANGTIDVGYKGHLAASAGGIDYYGYFDSYKCYTYSTSNNRFDPTRETSTKACGGTDEWSGDFLNYLTTARIDALRKVLYGGTRSTDTDSLTVLERSHIPMDAHSWGKEYTSVAVNGYDIRNYTPFTAPTSGRHLFANTTPNDQDTQWYDNNRSPRLRILLNSPYRIWEWVSKESPVAGTQVAPPGGNVNVSFSHELRVRVAVCVSGLIGRETCQAYPDGNYKPIGLLHEFGENDSMLFGLLTGSYTANKSGGVLRKNIGSIRSEINSDDGTFRSDVNGIVKTLDRLRVAGYGRYTAIGGTSYDCGLPAMARGAPQDGSCRMWGNPVAEMMYEGLRYFRGMTPTPAFTAIYGTSNTDIEGSTRLNLPRPTWQDPYEDRPVCSRPFQTLMADINNSYDTDQLPGTVFPLETGSNAISDPLPNLNVATLADQITAHEPSVAGLHFIGQSGTGVGSYDGAPTPKTVTSLSNIRGLAPEEPTKQGGYYAASVSYHGLTNDMSPTAAGDQMVQTFAVALASPLPKIEIPVGGRTITLVPFAKSVKYNSEIDAAQGSFQPTNQIVDFYVESLAADRTSGSFQVNFEDVEAGNDHDMDAIVRYAYQVSGNSVTVDVSSDYQAGGIIHHLGYVISGTTADGVYLVVQDCNKNTNGTYSCNGSDVDYFLDTPPGQGPGGTWNDGVALPGSSSRTFSVGTGATATLLKDPLWYAAKWGGFNDTNENDRPDLTAEWDQNGNGQPDNYFLVTNALTLSQQLRAAFDEIIARNASASSASVNSGSVSSDTRIYQAKFNSGTWTGQLLSYPVNTNGSLGDHEWDAANEIPSADTRNIVTVNSNGTPIPFRWDDLDNTRKAQIEPTYATDEDLAIDVLEYLRGDASNEERNGGAFRDRPSPLGDIVSSSPLFVGAPFFAYNDSLEDEPYSEFRSDNEDRTPVVYAGANDGMLHAFHGETGDELFAFIPSSAFRNLRNLSSPSYTHKYFVDAAPNMRDVFFNDNWHTVLTGGLNRGGQEVYALDITDPSRFSEDNAASLVLWEFTDRDGASTGITGDSDLGYTYSQPAIVRLQNGRWAAIFGNGYNNTEADGSASTTGNAVLYIVDIENGTLIRKIDTLEGMADDPVGQGRPNGLATPAVVDLDGDRIVDYVYAGDLFGNMWKFDIRHKTDVNQWKVAYGTTAAPAPLFTAHRAVDESDDGSETLAQPITSRPEVVRGPRGVGMMVLFGTGKYIETTDKIVDQDEPEVQTYYGIWDRNTNTATDVVASRTDLLSQSILLESSINFGSQSFNIRATSDHELTGQDGWYLDLLSPNGYEGERQVSNTTVRGSRVIFTTLIPDSDPCNYGGRSWLMELDALDGSRLDIAPFDLNNDGKFDDGDMVSVVIDGQTVRVPITGLQPNVGITPEPGILFAEGAMREYIYSPGTTGDITLTIGSTDPRARGRQSWRQIK